MRLDLYQAETAVIAREQAGMVAEARERGLAGGSLSRLEQNGVLHALQVLVENAIGKAKHLIKAAGEPVPVSAYDSFPVLARILRLSAQELEQWNAIIGLRKRIVHDYMSLDMRRVLQVVESGGYAFVVDFLLASPEETGK
ncbi:type VII toxin-antitoxin system HepT family RNase toxin [Thioalkalivibrio sp.]|uniref:type VII toxin-antitoxin system HepT family RNase toxin n=1 Tax=Thioalkalivibrio sp. TaxID=2093813 RepID=UPI003976C675